MDQPECGEVLIDKVRIKTFLLTLHRANLIIAVAPAGFVMCGYLDIAVAEKMGDAACIVSGVKTVEELLHKPVVKLTLQAQQRGISIGMSGQEALQRML